jgi:uncharacterized membrane protein
MTLLLIGLVLFLGAHSAQIFASGLRAKAIARLGAGPWKGLYTLVSVAGFVLILKGYAEARSAAALWPAPAGAVHATAALVLAGFILNVAAYWPANHIKAAVKDPMVLGVLCWAAGHLLVKSSPPALALFGGFLAWAALDFVSLRRRPAPPAGPPAKLINTIGVLALGSGLFALFAFWLHGLWLGVHPFG